MIPQVEQEAGSISSPDENQWSSLTRFGFRFVFCYFVLYLTPSAIGSRGLQETRIGSYHGVVAHFWYSVVPWIATSVLGIEHKVVEVPNGSGDQLFDYIWIVCIFAVALLACLIWTALDRKTRNYDRFNEWLRLFLRLFLASVMMLYGANKLFPTQFADIPTSRLTDSLGHLSPQGLLWTFMGYSRAYTFFGGLGEMVGGLLLIVPRFTTIGALVSAGVLSNVLMLNLCYDVPRKILTIHLLVICGLLILPDVRRMINLFFLNRPAQPRHPVPWLKDPLLNRGVLVLQYLFAISTLAIAIRVSYEGAKPVTARIGGPLQGMWAVDRFTSDNIMVPPLTTEPQRWYRVTFEQPQYFTVQRMTGPLQLFAFKSKTDGKTLEIWNVDDASQRGTVTVDTSDPNRLTMNGQVNGRSVDVAMSRVNLSDPVDFVLINRGFHWVTPVPLWRLDGK